MKNEIKIRNKTIGENHPLFIVAEVGVTCNYDMTIAKELIDVVARSGADAAKFIFWFPDEIMSDRSVIYKYETLNGMVSENMFEMLNKLRFSLEQWHELKRYADQKGVILFSTVNSFSGIEWAEEIGLEAYKLSSWDYNYEPLWRSIAAKGKPIIMDTGPVNFFEITKALQIMKDAGNEQSVIVHCYHTDKPEEMNMKSIPYLKRALNTVVGFSAKDRSDEMDYVSIGLGATFLEKRLTMSRALPGHHHVISKEPEEFIQYAREMRAAQSALGVDDLIPSPEDLKERKKWFRHLVAKKDLKAGVVLGPDHLEGKRDEGGISPEFAELFVGKRLRCDLKENESIRWEDVIF